MITGITATANHEEKAQLIEILTEEIEHKGKNFFHYLLSSTIEIEIKHNIVDVCRTIEINHMNICRLADKANNELKFPLDYAIDKAKDKIKSTPFLSAELCMEDVERIAEDKYRGHIRSEIEEMMRRDVEPNKGNGFDCHTSQVKFEYQRSNYKHIESCTFDTSTQDPKIESYHYFWGCDEAASMKFTDFLARHNYREQGILSDEFSFLRLNNTINKISVKVALLNKEELRDSASEGFREHAFPRIQCIKLLYDSLSIEEKGRLNADLCLDSKSINLFIQDEFPPLNNIDELLGLVQSGESAAVEDGVP